MQKLSLACLVIVVMTTPVHCQQPNSLPASLTVNGIDGPPFPIVNIFMFVGTMNSVVTRGAPGSAIMLVAAPQLTASSVPALGGRIDLDLTQPQTWGIILDGFHAWPGIHVTSGSGQFRLGIPLAPVVPPPNNTQWAFQAIVQNAASPHGATLTAASSVLVFSGISVSQLTLASDSCAWIDTLQMFGFQIPFYATNYGGCFVCSNGYITFAAPSTDFTPTYLEMHAQHPRIAPFWSDLDPSSGASGPVTLMVDQIDPLNPIVTVDYDGVPDWPVGVLPLALHYFTVELEIASGVVAIRQHANNQPSHYDVITGISSGLSLDPTGPGGMDISATLAAGPLFGLANEGFYEGFRGTSSVTGVFPPGATWDLSGTNWTYIALGPGASGAHYVMTSLP